MDVNCSSLNDDYSSQSRSLVSGLSLQAAGNCKHVASQSINLKTKPGGEKGNKTSISNFLQLVLKLTARIHYSESKLGEK